MLSFQLKKEVQQLLAAFEEAKSFFMMLNVINDSFPEIDNFLAQIGESGDKFNNSANQFRNHLAQLRNSVQKISVRKFFSSLEKFQKNLSLAKEYDTDELNIIDGISKSIDIFADRYGVFVGSHSLQSAALLITNARKLSSMLNGFKIALHFFESNLEEQHYELEGHRELSLLLPSELSLNQFALKLISIDVIYNELCSLLDISTSEYPLVICKIESGSLWAKVFGNDRIIALMLDFLNASASYIYRNFTNEGKLSAIPRKVEIVNSVLDFTSKLEAEGLNVIEAKEYIAKSAVKITKELNSLLDGQAEITINNKKHSIGEEIQKKLLEVGAPLKLEHNISEPNEDTNE